MVGRPDAVTEVQDMKAAIERFGVSILRPLIQLYKIPFTSVHIFYDWAGPLIAFNRNGSLFLNARYYIGWHDLVNAFTVFTVTVAYGVLNRTCKEVFWHKPILHGEQDALSDFMTKDN